MSQEGGGEEGGGGVAEVEEEEEEDDDSWDQKDLWRQLYNKFSLGVLVVGNYNFNRISSFTCAASVAAYRSYSPLHPDGLFCVHTI